MQDSFDQKYLQKTLLEEGDKHLSAKESEVIIFRRVWSSMPRSYPDLLENVRGTIRLPAGSFVVDTRLKDQRISNEVEKINFVSFLNI